MAVTHSQLHVLQNWSYCRWKFYIAGIRISDVCRSCDLDLDPMTCIYELTTCIYLSWACAIRVMDLWCDYCGRSWSWQACFKCLQDVFLLALAADMCSSLAEYWVCVTTIVHAFVASRVDYCNSVLSSAPKKVMDKLQHVQNAAARLVTGTEKYERGLSRLKHDDLHWLVVTQRVQ